MLFQESFARATLVCQGVRSEEAMLCSVRSSYSKSWEMSERDRRGQKKLAYSPRWPQGLFLSLYLICSLGALRPQCQDMAFLLVAFAIKATVKLSTNSKRSRWSVVIFTARVLSDSKSSLRWNFFLSISWTILRWTRCKSPSKPGRYTQICMVFSKQNQ